MSDHIEKKSPTVFYTKNNESTKSSHSVKSKTGRGKGNRNERTFQSKSKTKVESNDRIETFKPKVNKISHADTNFGSKTGKFNHNTSVENDSPWQKKIRDNVQMPSFGYDEHRQRKEETLVYSENSCKSVYKHRRSAIVKMFITQEMTYQFKDLIEWLVNQRLGYDIVSNEQITKLTQTPHHGGICLIIKKRAPLMLTDYLEGNDNKTNDCVLAIDDVNNPHNLGGLIRSAAFYAVNGVMLRQSSLLDSGAAMRVAEGAIEAIKSIKSDDFVASLDLFKQHGYQVVALLPCQNNSIKSRELHQVKFNQKVVLVIFQQINMKLINCADVVIHLKGNDNMPALNISVATGILLSYIHK